MAGDRVKVLYVAGWLYTGSTLLGNVLGEIDGFAAVGELRFLWKRGFLENDRCGCGTAFLDCPIWTRVAGALDGVDPARIADLTDRLLLHRRLPQLLVALRGGPGASEVRELRSALADLYDAIAATAGSRVIVDTSKSPLYAAILDGIPSIDLRVVHLVRDPRGALWSRLRRGSGLEPATGLLLWDLSHLVSEVGWSRSGRYLRLRYEDVVRRPVEAVGAILELAGEQAGPPEFLERDRVALRPNHNVAGNPNRLRSGTIELRLDDAWRRLPARPLAAATALTWPLLLRYGYPLVPRR